MVYRIEDTIVPPPAPVQHQATPRAAVLNPVAKRASAGKIIVMSPGNKYCCVTDGQDFNEFPLDLVILFYY